MINDELNSSSLSSTAHTVNTINTNNTLNSLNHNVHRPANNKPNIPNDSYTISNGYSVHIKASSPVTATGIGNLLTTCTPNNNNIYATINSKNINMNDITTTVKSVQPISVISSGTTCSTSTSLSITLASMPTCNATFNPTSLPRLTSFESLSQFNLFYGLNNLPMIGSSSTLTPSLTPSAIPSNKP